MIFRSTTFNLFIKPIYKSIILKDKDDMLLDINIYLEYLNDIKNLINNEFSLIFKNNILEKNVNK